MVLIHPMDASIIKPISGAREPIRIKDNSDLGDLDLYLLLDEGPRRTAYVNRMGMLISDSTEQKVNPVSPRRSSLWPGFCGGDCTCYGCG